MRIFYITLIILCWCTSWLVADMTPIRYFSGAPVVVDSSKETAAVSQISEKHLIVTTVVNDMVSGRFIVDTGATCTMLSARMAAKLGLDLAELPGTEVVLANGEKEPAIKVFLSSVSVGEARAENVEALITKDAASPDLDGLLGMSFLKYFELRVDAQKKTVILIPLK
jgi:clan AA aspartic protease (TIGR02281 family)